MQKAENKIWCPAIYARLSKEDDETKKGFSKKGLSLSIEHQIELLKDYVKDKGWQSPKVFYDDDRTGTNFDRKGFQDMYSEARKGNINVIVIKDISRFGRNWVQSGMYFEKIEDMGIRFISIQECIDTADPKCPALKMLPFYFIFSEWHSQTTSEKIRTVFEKQNREGKLRTVKAPYGYIKDPKDKHKLIIDPYAAEVVKRIYKLRLEKRSCMSIARTLNDENILSPSSYYYTQQKGEENKRSRDSYWSNQSVSELIYNPVYRGDIAHNKYVTKNYKNRKQICNPMDEWIIVKDMHEPIVSREDWQKCYDMKAIGRVRSTKYKEISPFTSLLECADCGYRMIRSSTNKTRKSGERKTYISYNCGTFKRKGAKACVSHHIPLSHVNEIVLADIRSKAGEVLQDEKTARERYFEIKAQTNGIKLQADRSALKKISRRLEELDKLIQAAFEKTVLSGQSSEVFTNLEQRYTAEKQELTEQSEILKRSIEKYSQTENDVNTFIKLMKKYVNITEIDRATAVELIDKITITANKTEPREVVIYYNFVGCVDV